MIERKSPSLIEKTVHTASETQPNSDLTVLILAGGQSSRMGQDKALMLWEGKPLLTRVCDAAIPLSPSIQILSSWPKRYKNIVPPPVERCLEEFPGQGPLWALNDGLRRNQSAWILLLACDMPYLDTARLKYWRSQLSTLPQTCLAYVPQTPSGRSLRWEPLCGFYRQSCQFSLQQFLTQGGRSFQQWLNHIEVKAIPLIHPDPSMFYNCNSPDDLIPNAKSSVPLP